MINMPEATTKLTDECAMKIDVEVRQRAPYGDETPGWAVTEATGRARLELTGPTEFVREMAKLIRDRIASTEPVLLGRSLLCRRCDVFVGFGAVGVVQQPDRSAEWLAQRCWMCGRTVDDISAAGELVEVPRP